MTNEYNELRSNNTIEQEFELVANEYKAMFDFLQAEGVNLELITDMKQSASFLQVQNLADLIMASKISFEV